MLLKISRLVGVSVAGMALAHTAFAQNANVTTAVESAKLGGEFRSELLWKNQGLKKTKGTGTPDSSLGFQVQDARIKLSGKLNPSTDYGIRFKLINADKDALNYGYLTHWLTKDIGISFGKMKVLQGGWDGLEWNGTYNSHVIGPWAAKGNLPFNSYEAMGAFHLNLLGKLTLQVFNDVSTKDDLGTTGRMKGNYNNAEKLTFALGWIGEFGPVQPLVNFGSYDNNKSMWVDAGIKTAIAGMSANLDYRFVNQARKVADPAAAGKSKDLKDTTNSVSLRAGYQIREVATPWIYASLYEKKQDEDKATGSVDLKVNSAEEMFDDNGTVWGVGTDFHTFGKNFTPYLAVIGRSGNWTEGNVAGAKKEARNDVQVKLGVFGEI